MIDKETQRKLDKLTALENAGVENWGFYSDALEEWNKEGEIEEVIDGAVQDINELLATAEVDFPAGREYGHSIKYSEDELKKILSKLIKDVG